MKVTFENGITDSMVLEPYAESSCNFIGQLANHPSTVAVTGCLKQPGDRMAITLLSDFNTKSHMYEMDYDGNVELVENPFKYQQGYFENSYCIAYIITRVISLTLLVKYRHEQQQIISHCIS